MIMNMVQLGASTIGGWHTSAFIANIALAALLGALFYLFLYTRVRRTKRLHASASGFPAVFSLHSGLQGIFCAETNWDYIGYRPISHGYQSESTDATEQDDGYFNDHSAENDTLAPRNAQDDIFADYDTEETLARVYYHSIAIQIQQKTTRSTNTSFRQMRKIRDNIDRDSLHCTAAMVFSPYAYFDAVVFKAQAVYMADFTDNYGKVASFQYYCAAYNYMNDAQLHTYFTWRTKVRQGIVSNLDEGYVRTYLYELFNNIGTADCFDALEKILFVWRAYNQYNPSLCKYLPGLIKDYFICEDFGMSFAELLEKYDLQSYYPQATAEHNDHASLTYYNELGSYDIFSSKFYTKDKKELLEQCFNAVFHAVSAYFLQNKCDFRQLLCGELEKQSWWYPFRNAIYLADENAENKRVEISPQELYERKNGNWCRRTLPMHFAGGAIAIGYVIKRMEAKIRRITGFKYKLSPNVHTAIAQLESCGKRKTKKLRTLFAKSEFDATIDNAVQDFFALHYPHLCKAGLKSALVPKADVHLDHSKFEKIRTEALLVQERLLVDDSPEAPPVQAVTREIEAVEEESSFTDVDVWHAFQQTLTDTQTQVLRMLYTESASPIILRKLAQDNGGMLLEVLLESINEAALDCIGDNVMDTSGASISLYDEYIEEIGQLLRRV